MLIWYAQATYLPFATVQIGNGGAFKNTPENAETLSLKEQDKLVARIMESADFYSKRFLDYMCNNSNLYTEYTNNTSGNLYPDKDSNYSNWVI